MGKKIISAVFAAVVLGVGFVAKTEAQSQGGFAVQVTPSPIVETIQPGVSKTVEVKIRNQNTQNETLKMGLRAFTISSETGEVSLKTEEPSDVKDWVVFENPTFDVAAGEWYTQKVQLSPPANAGFTYSFAITVSRANPVKESGGRTTIEGSVAIFALLTTDKPGATRKLDIQSLVSKKKVYDYLPTELTLSLKNSGNTIVQPAGNIYIQRSEKSLAPIAVLPVNATAAYILPDITRSLTTKWDGGFPVYKTDAINANKKNLTWEWAKLENFRIGHYVAKAVVVYNDGTRDVPIEAVVGFWVIPWKMLAVLLLVIILLVVGVATVVRRIVQTTHKKRARHEPSHESKE